MGQDQPDKNAQIAIVDIAMLPSLSNTMSLSSSPIYSGSSTHPSSKSATFCSLSSATKSLHPMLQNANISLTSLRIFANLNIKINHKK